jgi:hypothetical protein
MKKRNIARILAICLATVAICSGCQKSEEEPKINTDIAQNSAQDSTEAETETEIVQVAYGEDAVSTDNTISCKLENIKATGTTYEDSSTQLLTANLTITNNTSEKLEPNYLTYFRVYQHGTSVGAFSLTTDLAAARDSDETFFPDGIEVGETVTSKIYMEVPLEFDELEFVYAPYSVNTENWTTLSLGTTFTMDDIQPAE